MRSAMKNKRELILINFVVDTLVAFSEHLRKSGYEEYAKYLRSDLHKYIFNNIIGVKYKRIFLNSANLFQENDKKKDE